MSSRAFLDAVNRVLPR
ncbi:MAG: hypothetical protein V8S95_09880 [Odoribacter sp.]